MIDEADRIKHAERVLGTQANSFFESDLGQYIVGRSAETVQENYDMLADADPEDIKTIRQCQQNIAIAKIGLHWINEALGLGHQRFEMDQIEAAQRD